MGFTRPKPVAPRRPGHATHRLPLIFAVTILVPGLVLGFLGLRALLQERQLAEQQVRERVAVIAESTGRQLELDLRDWQQAAEQISLMGPADSARWPYRVRLAMAQPGGAVLLAGSQPRPDVLPAWQLLYAMSPVPRTSPAEPPSSLVTRAETLELREGQHDAAIALYRETLGSAQPAERAAVLHRLGRALKKADMLEDAARTFRFLEQEPPVLIGSLPSDLLALYALFSMGSSQRSVQFWSVSMANKSSIVSDLHGWRTPSVSGEELQAPGKSGPQ